MMTDEKAGTLTLTSLRSRYTQRRQASVIGRMVDDAVRLGPLSRLRLLVIAFIRHGRIGPFLLWSIFGPPMYAFTQVCMWLDTVFYPQLRTMRLDRPVFIIGHPRSGSTFLQRHVHASGRATMFRTWELWFPSLVQRKLIRPLLPVLRMLDLDLLQGAEYGHEIRLHGIEEDEGLFLHQLDSEMVTFICPRLVTDPAFRRIGLRLGRLGARQTKHSLRFYRACLKRQVIWTGNERVVVKCNPSVFRLPHMRSIFPQARFVYLVRSPGDGIRSFLALNHRHVAPLLSPREERAYLRGKYEWSVDLYRRFEDARRAVDRRRIIVFGFHELTNDTTGTLRRFFRFAEIEPDPSFWTRLESGNTRRRTKRHANPPLSRLGIEQHEVDRDLGWIRETYGGAV